MASILKRSDLKQCPLDAAPTWLIKHVSDVLAPVIARMCNASFNQVKLPDRSKKASTAKKQTLDPNDPASFRPISIQTSSSCQRSYKSVDARIAEHVNRHQLLPVFQSAYQSCIKYSTNKYQYQYQYQWSKYQYKYQYLTFKYQYQYWSVLA